MPIRVEKEDHLLIAHVKKGRKPSMRSLDKNWDQLSKDIDAVKSSQSKPSQR